MAAVAGALPALTTTAILPGTARNKKMKRCQLMGAQNVVSEF